MNFCPEIAVLQGALQFVHKQKKLKTVHEPQLKEAASPVEIVHIAVREITQGLEEDNSAEEQDIWSQKIHNLIMYKAFTSHYEELLNQDHGKEIDGKDGEDAYQNGWVEPKMIDRLDILSGVLPPVCLSLYFDLVKECDWYSYNMEALRHIESGLSVKLINDVVKYMQKDKKVDLRNLVWILKILEHLLSFILTSPGNPVDAQPYAVMADLLYAVLMQCSSMINSVDCSHVAALVQFSDFFLHGFSQISLLISLCSLEMFETDLIWCRSNLIGKPNLNENDNNSKIQESYGKMVKCTTTLHKLDLNLPLLNAVRKVASMDCLLTILIKIMSLAAQDLSCKILDLISYKSVCDSKFVSIGKAVIQMKSDLHYRELVPVKVDIECDSRNLCQLLIKAVNSIKSPELQVMSETVSSYMESLIETIVEDSEFNMAVKDMEDFVDFSVSAMIWRIHEQQPGFQDCIRKFMQSHSVILWSSKRLVENLQMNIELISCDETMLLLYDVVSETFSKLENPQVERILQLALSGFGELDTAVRSNHILQVHKTYTFWPKHNPSLTGTVNQTLNKLTSGMEDKVLVEVHQIALQDTKLMLGQLIERAVNSKQQADIICYILQTLPHICTFTRGKSWSMLIDNFIPFLSTHDLNKKEQDVMVHFIQSIIQPLRSQEFGRLLQPEELLTISVIPHLTLYNYQGNMNSTLSVRFALDLGIMLFENMIDSRKCSDNPDVDLNSCLVSVAELLQDCVDLWVDSSGERVTMKERLLKFLQKVEQYSISNNSYCADWVVVRTATLDSTVRLALLKVCLSCDTFDSVCDDLCQNLIDSGKDIEWAEIFRLASAEGNLSQKIILHIQQLKPTLTYPAVLLNLCQVLPNLLVEEWIQLFELINELVKSKVVHVQVKLIAGGMIPLIDLNEVGDILPLSQLICDLLCILSMTGESLCLQAQQHCIQSAMSILKKMVLSRVLNVPNTECRLFALSLIFSHMIKATAGFVEEIQDSVNILLLDVTCNVEDTVLEMTQKLQVKGQLLEISAAAKTIKNKETKNMIEKKIRLLM